LWIFATWDAIHTRDLAQNEDSQGKLLQPSRLIRYSPKELPMKTLLLLLACIIASSFGIALTEGTMNSVFQYVLMGTVGISTLVLLSGVTD